MVTAMMFAGWFGAETVLGIPATFMEEGLLGLISDPFGAAACLVLFGVFFARRLYRLNMMTIGDFYRQRYDRGIEVISGLAIALSYLGWVAAQITALGMVLNILTDNMISVHDGILLGTGIVLIYTIVGGLWSVAVTVSMQIVVTVIGLTAIAWMVSQQTGGVQPVVDHALSHGALSLPEDVSPLMMLAMLTTFITLAFGSIPQQDVFQRANAAKTETIAAWSAILGGLLYLAFTLVPLFIAYAINIIDPAFVTQVMANDGENLLPQYIKTQLPITAQILFYGALVGVIMGTSASTLLAPTFMISENLLKGLFPRPLSDKQLLLMTRIVLVVFASCVAAYALWSREQDTGIHAMVEAAYKVTLVVAFVPLVAGLFWSKANAIGAWWSVSLGFVVWVGAELSLADAEVGAQWWGLLASIFGMMVGSRYGQKHSYTLANERV
jgi:Na+/proline symporter